MTVTFGGYQFYSFQRPDHDDWCVNVRNTEGSWGYDIQGQDANEAWHNALMHVSRVQAGFHIESYYVLVNGDIEVTVLLSPLSTMYALKHAVLDKLAYPIELDQWELTLNGSRISDAMHVQLSNVQATALHMDKIAQANT